MQEILLNVIKEGSIITGFIFVMMLVIEYINVRTDGIWQKHISGERWKQYLLGAVLGAIPGCLGAYTAVALYSHRVFSLGAIVTTMIATSGDEAFVMFAMIPEQAFIIVISLMIIGVVAGYLTDKFVRSKDIESDLNENEFPLHKEESCECYNLSELKRNLKSPSTKRIIILLFIISLLTAVLSGILMGEAPTWIKYTVGFTGIFSLFIVISVPEHFIKEHIWEHILKVHLPKILIWTLGTLFVINILLYYVDIDPFIGDNMVLVLLFAVLIGILPQSGPHLVFLTLFAQGTIPLSILLASSISQDGHGMLPLLAESKKSFIVVKLINVVIALVVGYGLYLFGV